MAIYHFEGQVISRTSGRTSVAAAAYRSRERLYNEYDGLTHDYTYRHDLLWEQIILPPNAQAAWQDRETLWNAVELSETQKDNRLAREFNAALPIELDLPEWKQLLTDFIQQQFVSQGMCADVVIHNPGDGHNPHAHIMLTVRPLKENGEWANKTEKEYLCVRDGEERGFTAAEFKEAKLDGWGKQYPFFVGKKKIYMTAAEGEDRKLKRASKYPKCTLYGRQNPIAERWNSDEQFVAWRAAWADAVNIILEQNQIDQRADHRSNAARGIEEKPTIHEGVIARALERKGILSDRCELNRQIKADNILVRELKAEIKRLEKQARGDDKALAGALEQSQNAIIMIRYQIIFNYAQITKMKSEREKTMPIIHDYHNMMKELKPMQKQRASLKKELDHCSPVQLIRKAQLQKQIDELSTAMVPYVTRQNDLLKKLGCKDDKAVGELEKKMESIRSSIAQAEHRANVLDGQHDEQLARHMKLMNRITPDNAAAIDVERDAIRQAQRDVMLQKIYGTYGNLFEQTTMNHAVKITEDIICRDVNGKLYLSHLGKKGNEYLSHPTKPL